MNEYKQQEEILKDLQEEMLYYKELMLNQFTCIRTGAVNPKILDKIKVTYYNVQTPLKHISSITVFEGNQLHIKPFDEKLTTTINKAILSANLGVTPQNENNIIKLIFPRNTEEQRQKLTKEINKIAEQTKINIRKIRRLGNDKIKKLKLNQDSEKCLINKIQDLNNKYIQIIEIEKNNKNKELLTV
ncbi:ribosome-recycling factor [Candidatus Phytoplasma melaleucae]|uniref:Ribosome recycling factor n=1 Tax=Candidatus Phytoplasma melaleucae TaxID=2982630 RepID=A0ABT9DCY5_9MOLU|nr:ribosome-recycling factor ['Melaleuca sp.' phytoplasma]MDO8167971.1 ribosome recycling factor ['Melaleuca sp.' phytoplasma]MDV3205393.1 ribosome-recycling factor [Weeping tea tree witches'-broom phytoplasma]